MRGAQAEAPDVSKMPVCTVKRVEQIVGPRGGKLLLLTLSCGHWQYRRGDTPPESMPCLGCWAAARATGAG